jgi:hypothetical protein
MKIKDLINYLKEFDEELELKLELEKELSNGDIIYPDYDVLIDLKPMITDTFYLPIKENKGDGEEWI